MRDGPGRNVVKSAGQATLPHRGGNVRQQRSDSRRRHPRLLTADLHGLTHFLKEGGGPIINNVGRHDGRKLKENNQTEKERKMSKSKEKCEKEETEIKVRYSDTFIRNNTKKKNSKEKRKMQKW
jgi:hypothetical protein